MMVGFKISALLALVMLVYIASVLFTCLSNVYYRMAKWHADLCSTILDVWEVCRNACSLSLDLVHSVGVNYLSGCWVNNTLYGNNETFETDSCTSCVCRVRRLTPVPCCIAESCLVACCWFQSGSVQCDTVQCPALLCRRKIKLTGQCCYQCLCKKSWTSSLYFLELWYSDLVLF